MPNSCKSIIKRLRHNGAITQAEYDKLMRKLDGWIPVSERLPEEDERVIVTCLDIYHEPDVDVATYDRYSEWFKRYVTAWMPLPEPWRGEDETSD